MSSPNPTRNTNVDALRFLCALGIVTHHATGAFITDNNLIATIVRYSFVYSVNIFFIISGYAISESLKSYKPSLSNAVNYVMRRSIRLDAPYWLILVVYFILETLLKQRSYGLVDLLANAVYSQRIFGFQQILGVAWTLCIEVQFYLLMLLIASFRLTPIQSASMYAFLITGTIAIKYIWGLFLDGNFVFQFLPWFTIGIIASWHKVSPSRFSLLLVTGVLATQCLLDGSDYRDVLCTTVYGTVAYLLITNVEQSRASTDHDIVKVRSTKFVEIAALGSYTYSVYLTHMLAIKVVSKIGLFPNASAKVAVAVMMTAIMAWLLNRLIEKPALLLSRKISYHH
jgi:peptidoglycan/LPS O-acetylase OafA/YrhL